MTLGTLLNAVLKGVKMEELVDREDWKPYVVRWNELSTEGGCILWGEKVIIPKSLRENVLQELHEVHPGMTRMKALARSYVWWPGINEEIGDVVRHCEICQKNQSNPVSAPVHPWEYPAGPWE